MKDFSEQREQSDACIGNRCQAESHESLLSDGRGAKEEGKANAESRGDWAKPMNNEE